MKKYQIYINNVNVSNSSNIWGSIECEEELEEQPMKITIIKNNDINNTVIKYNSMKFNSNKSYKDNLLDNMPSGIQSKININPINHFSYLGNLGIYNDSFYR